MHLSCAHLRRNHLVAVEYASRVAAEAHEQHADDAPSRGVLDDRRDRIASGPTVGQRGEGGDQGGSRTVGGDDVQRIAGRRPLDVPMTLFKSAQPTLQPLGADVEGA